VAFRVGADDAEFLRTQFEPSFGVADLMNIDNYNAYLKMLIGGVPTTPFNIATFPAPNGNPEQAEDLKKLSKQKYGRDKVVVEGEVNKKYLKN
jgi:hypothetical protein